MNEMVKEVQAERESTASKILLHIANTWLNIKENIAQQNPYINSLSQAMQHAFVKKIGDLSDPDWLKSTHFNVNVAVTAAFLDPIVHSQLAYLCDKIPAFDYEKMKQIIHKAARPFVGQSPRITSTKRTMFPQLQTIEWIYKPIDDELSMYTTMRKYTDDALEFWNETILPNLSKVAKIFLGIEASSSPSERSFKLSTFILYVILGIKLYNDSKNWSNGDKNFKRYANGDQLVIQCYMAGALALAAAVQQLIIYMCHRLKNP
ncbi:hypothetical protein DdX_19566 [Ditylenchus destructor]|uniref:HAT C-terminal dimerisation domain-containing protein n=1 Tax=Ditylenchus destructor TaxID=166010 RepID=A0AAD4MHJ1_9BILA|nr:hypothetical protein DdX_19566 [Ditylenchus destructor]